MNLKRYISFSKYDDQMPLCKPVIEKIKRISDLL